MPRYKWTIVFDADDIGEAKEMVEQAQDEFDSIHSDSLVELEEGD